MAFEFVPQITTDQQNPGAGPFRAGRPVASRQRPSGAGICGVRQAVFGGRLLEGLEPRRLFGGGSPTAELLDTSDGGATALVLELNEPQYGNNGNGATGAGQPGLPPVLNAPLPPPAGGTPAPGVTPEGNTGGTTVADGPAFASGTGEVTPPSRSGSDFRFYLRPGSGFSGPTAQPAAVGSPQAVGYDAKAIARWDVVPFQTFTGAFNVGVVAFHREGIDRVEFSVNGGPWLAVRQMTLNPQTGVNEYVATLNAADYADGALEVRAVAYPTVGEPRVLESLPLNANAGGGLASLVRYVSPTGNDSNNGLTPATAFATTNRAAHSITQAQGNSDGGFVYLLPGTYTLNSAAWNTGSVTVNRWMTVTTAPGYTRDQVVIAGSVGSVFNSKLIKFQNVTITGSIASGGPVVDNLWIDNCHMQGSSRVNGYAGVGVGWSTKYMTDSLITDVGTAVDGLALGRNILVERAGGDAFSGSVLLINSEVRDYEQPPGSHTDVWQAVSRLDNVILYGVRATETIREINSAIKTENGASNMAVVDCDFVSNGFNVLYFDKQYDHLLFKNTRFTGGVYMTNRPPSHNAVFENTTFTANLPVFPDVTYR
jgi:hypothetical protein